MTDVSFGFHTKEVQDKINFHYQKIHTQGLQMYGNEVYFMRYTIDKDLTDKIFVEQQNKTYSEIYKMRMMAEDVSRMEGNGDLFSKFGLEIQDEMTLYISRIDFYEKVTGIEVTTDNFAEVEQLTLSIESAITPKIDDLVYIPFWNSIFTLTFNEEQEMMIMGNAFYKLTFKKWRPDSDVTIELPVSGTGIDSTIIDYLNSYIDVIYAGDPDFSETGVEIKQMENMNKEFENEGNVIRDKTQNGDADFFNSWG